MAHATYKLVGKGIMASAVDCCKIWLNPRDFTRQECQASVSLHANKFEMILINQSAVTYISLPHSNMTAFFDHRLRCVEKNLIDAFVLIKCLQILVWNNSAAFFI